MCIWAIRILVVRMWGMLVPRYLENSSGVLTVMKLALVVLASASASMVFPHPDGPCRRIPFVARIPVCVRVI